MFDEAFEDFGCQPDIDWSPVCWAAVEGGEDALVRIHLNILAVLLARQDGDF